MSSQTTSEVEPAQREQGASTVVSRAVQWLLSLFVPCPSKSSVKMMSSVPPVVEPVASVEPVVPVEPVAVSTTEQMSQIPAEVVFEPAAVPVVAEEASVVAEESPVLAEEEEEEEEDLCLSPTPSSE